MATLSPSAGTGPAAPTAVQPPPPAAVAVPAIVADACPTCGAAMAGDWCAACGERRLRPEHFSIRHFFRELSAEVLELDGRALRSVRLLLTRPGFLTLEALQGRRRPYLGVFKMYLGVFALMMLVLPLFQLDSQPGAQKSDAITAWSMRLMHEIAVRRGMTDQAAKQALLTLSMQHEQWVAFGIPLLFAAMLFAIFRRRRRWFGEHLLFATHFATFNYLFALAVVPMQMLANVVPRLGALGLFLLSSGLMISYMSVAIRRVYGGGRGASVGWGLLLMLCFSLAQGVVAIVAVATAAARLAYL